MSRKRGKASMLDTRPQEPCNDKSDPARGDGSSSNPGDVAAKQLGAHPVQAHQEDVAQADLRIRFESFPQQPCTPHATALHRCLVQRRYRGTHVGFLRVCRSHPQKKRLISTSGSGTVNNYRTLTQVQ